MDFKSIEKLLDLAKESGVSELKFENSDFKVKITMPTAPQANRPQEVVYGPTPAPAPTVVSSSAPLPAAVTPQASPGTHDIKSPFVGTFYASPSPSEPPFIKVGDKVKKGQVLCVLEAMKIMNEIEADIDGEVVEVAVSNDALVEYGQILFRLR